MSEWRYLDLRSNVCLLLDYSRSLSLLIHSNAEGNGDSLSAHITTEEYVRWEDTVETYREENKQKWIFY